MTLPVCPDDTWGKDSYKEDTERWQKDVASLSHVNLTREKKKCFDNIIRAIAESEYILENSGKRLGRAEKDRLYELWQSRWNNFYGLVK